jgi:oligopeptide/dipeptide ABC transporter ATP-binding protein
MTEPGDVLLEVKDLRTHFLTRRGVGKAVDGVSFTLRASETLGLVGESGSGKSMTCLSVTRLNPRRVSRIVGGQVLFRGEDLLLKSEREMRGYRGRHIAMVLQDPMTALNPVFTIGNQLCEPLALHQGLRGRRLRQRAIEVMRRVRIPAPETRLGSYPHQFSGGMRQRTVGAIALSCRPEILIADEPTTALDVTIQAAFLELLREIQRESRLGILFVTHDFGVVGRMCDRVAVMYAGKIVETADTRMLFASPAHPYTEALLRSVPDVQQDIGRLYSIEGQPPSIFDPTPGCPFAPRCPAVEPRCREAFPPEREVAPGHAVSCWRHVP